SQQPHALAFAEPCMGAATTKQTLADEEKTNTRAVYCIFLIDWVPRAALTDHQRRRPGLTGKEGESPFRHPQYCFGTNVSSRGMVCAKTPGLACVPNPQTCGGP